MPQEYVTSVDRIYGEAHAILLHLNSAGELSLAIAAEDVLRKSLLLSAASYFEHALTSRVMEFVLSVTGDDQLVPALVRNKAVSRQYHTWFNWDGANANQFFGLFGDDFKQYMMQIVVDDDKMASGIKSFMTIGRERNRLAHQDYASFSMSLTSDEIYGHYKAATHFVDSVSIHLRYRTA